MDNTLVDVGTAHRQGLHAALTTVYGLEGRHGGPKHAGNTQPNILRMLLRSQGVRDNVIEARLAEASRVHAETTIRLLAEDLRPAILPGVVPLLEALKRDGHICAVVTGTVSATARTILERSRLMPYFCAYAFGDEGAERIDLLHLAISRAVLQCGWSADSQRIVVIGDAPADIQAGQALGARVVAVATGFADVDLLAEYNPDVILESLTDLQATLEAITGCLVGPGGLSETC